MYNYSISKKTRILLSFLLITVFFSTGSAQYFQNNKWHFGYNGAVDFNTGAPVAVLGSAIFTSEGSASVADRITGNLLFYTNVLTVWNSLNQPMPNGTGLLGGTPALTSSTTAARIVPRPGNPTQYYVFTVDESGGPGGLRLNLVDMTLNGGLGDVVAGSKNILIASNVTEKLEYAPHPNGTDYWLVSREIGGNQYMTWQVTATSVSTTPVISFAGVSSSNGAGYLKFNSTYTQLANANVFGSVDLLSFNNANGQISNIVSLPVPIGSSVYGVEFSRSGRYLYVSNLLNGLFQFDLNAATGARLPHLCRGRGLECHSRPRLGGAGLRLYSRSGEYPTGWKLIWPSHESHFYG